ncbi:MAG: hypothetical protein IK008_00960 [Bacteroidales bacterium]|nr:hypothetical protein [Bacteroidales bacterium]
MSQYTNHFYLNNEYYSLSFNEESATYDILLSEKVIGDPRLVMGCIKTIEFIGLDIHVLRSSEGEVMGLSLDHFRTIVDFRSLKQDFSNSALKNMTLAFDSFFIEKVPMSECPYIHPCFSLFYLVGVIGDKRLYGLLRKGEITQLVVPPAYESFVYGENRYIAAQYGSRWDLYCYSETKHGEYSFFSGYPSILPEYIGIKDIMRDVGEPYPIIEGGNVLFRNYSWLDDYQAEEVTSFEYDHDEFLDLRSFCYIVKKMGSLGYGTPMMGLYYLHDTMKLSQILLMKTDEINGMNLFFLSVMEKNGAPIHMSEEWYSLLLFLRRLVVISTNKR